MAYRYLNSVRLIIAVASLLTACGAPAPRPTLPAATGAYRRLDNAVVIQLPDTGGYAFNGQPVPVDSLTARLQDVFGPQDSASRAVFVVDNPKRAWADVARIANAARSAGGRAFDGASSGHGSDFTPVPRPAGLR